MNGGITISLTIHTFIAEMLLKFGKLDQVFRFGGRGYLISQSLHIMPPNTLIEKPEPLVKGVKPQGENNYFLLSIRGSWHHILLQ